MARFIALLPALWAALFAAGGALAQPAGSGIPGATENFDFQLLQLTGYGLKEQSGPVQVEWIPGWRSTLHDRPVHYAGLVFKLAEGWKTYWRVPGEYGLPLSIDWSGSSNLESTQLLWPKPEIFDTSGVRVIGYADEVVLPVIIWPADETEPIELQSFLEFGVCKDVCVPVSLSLSTTLSPHLESVDETIKSAFFAVPKNIRSADKEHFAECRFRPLGTSGLQVSASLTVPRMGFAEEVAVFEMPGWPIWFENTVTVRSDSSNLSATAFMRFLEDRPFAIDRSNFIITILGSDEAVQFTGC